MIQHDTTFKTMINNVRGRSNVQIESVRCFFHQGTWWFVVVFASLIFFLSLDCMDVLFLDFSAQEIFLSILARVHRTVWCLVEQPSSSWAFKQPSFRALKILLSLFLVLPLLSRVPEGLF